MVLPREGEKAAKSMGLPLLVGPLKLKAYFGSFGKPNMLVTGVEHGVHPMRSMEHRACGDKEAS
jgi:hypothetical protein